MNKGLWFALGAAAGSFVTWIILKKRYSYLEPEELEEIDYETVKEERSQNEELKAEEVEDFIFKSLQNATDAGIKNFTEKPPLVNYAKEIVKNEYAQNDDVYKPYVIRPEEFGDIDDYAQVTLTYYSDGVLVDENDDIVDDVAAAVGEDFATHFGEYEEDSVYVRNDIRSCDYEILADLKTYKEVLKLKPKPVTLEEE